MNKADVAGVDAAVTAACNASRPQSQGPALQKGTWRRSLKGVDDVAAISDSSAADRAPGTEGDECAEDCAQAAAHRKDKVVVGYWKEHSTLTHVVIRNAGHMVCPSHLY